MIKKDKILVSLFFAVIILSLSLVFAQENFDEMGQMDQLILILLGLFILIGLVFLLFYFFKEFLNRFRR